MKSSYSSLIGVLVFGVLSSGAAFARDFTDVPDIKRDVMRVYGVRSARALDEKTVRIVIGSSVTHVRSQPKSYRIIGDGDNNYAYRKFVTPTKVLLAKPSKNEFDIPGGVRTKGAATSLTRSEVTLELPYPLKKGVRYHVIAQGEGGTMVTAGLCAASFVYGEKPDADDDGDRIAARMTGLRRISSVGDGKVLCEFGHGYSPDGGLRLSNWKVLVNGEERKILALGRRTRLECYQPTGWPFKGYLEHSIFLDLGGELKKGDNVVVEVSPGVCAGVRSASMRFDPAKSLSQSIKVNQVGYLPDALKVAYVGRWLGSMPDSGVVSSEAKGDDATNFSKEAYYAEAGKGTQEERENARIAAEKAAEAEKEKIATASAPTSRKNDYDSLAPYALRLRGDRTFSLLEAASGRKVFEGALKLVHNGLDMDGKANHSAENVYEADFTEFKKPGVYVLSVDGVGRSLQFEISADVYKKAFLSQARGIYLQRCGCEIDPKLSGGWERTACHNKGIITTTVQRHSAGEWGDFTDNMEMDPNPDYPLVKLRREKVENDPSRLKPEFKLVGKTKRVSDAAFKEVFACGDDQTHNGVETSPIAFDPDKGLTFSFMVRRDDSLAGNNWGGRLFGIGEGRNLFAIWVNWGVVKFHPKFSLRINDKKWHRVVVRISPADAGKKHPVDVFYDGQRWGGMTASVDLTKPQKIEFAKASGAAEGLYTADPMLFNRALDMSELKDLASSVPEKIPHRLHVRGGHHDAGDYNPRSHIDVAQALLNAYELAPENFTDSQLSVPERGNGIPDIVDEAIWAVRLWEGLQDSDGGVRNGTESQGDPNFIQTVELDDKGDYAWAKDVKGSYLASGVFAQLSRILEKCGKKKRSNELLLRSRRAYEWAEKNPVKGMKSLSDWGEYHLALRAYAAAQLYHTTWEKRYHDDFIASTPWREKPETELMSHGYFNLQLAAYAYVMIPREKADGAVWDAVLGSIRKEGEMYVRGSGQMAYKFLRHPYAPITWGTGAYENYAVPAAYLWKLTGENRWRDWLVRTCDNTLGANPMGLSWITGLGSRTVRCPLHNSRYRPEGLPADGIQEQGPNKNFAGYSYRDTAYPRCAERFALLYQHSDVHFAIAMDEPTVNNMANTMFIFGLLSSENPEK